MSNLPTGAAVKTTKPRQYKAGPVLLFDNLPASSISDLELLTIEDVAGILKISTAGVRRLQQQRQMPFLKIGGSIRFAKKDIVAFLAKCRIEAVE